MKNECRRKITKHYKKAVHRAVMLIFQSFLFHFKNDIFTNLLNLIFICICHAITSHCQYIVYSTISEQFSPFTILFLLRNVHSHIINETQVRLSTLNVIFLQQTPVYKQTLKSNVIFKKQILQSHRIQDKILIFSTSISQPHIAP